MKNKVMLFKHFPFIFGILIFFSVNVDAQCDRKSDSLELVKFYNATDGPNWSNQTNWLQSGKGINSWYGIKLNSEGCVISIELSNNNIKFDLFNLNFPSLVHLDLRLNNLTGSIPNFDKLPNLISLDLGSNKLKGTIPNFDKLGFLQDLSLYFNQLSGEIPNFGHLKYLKNLDLTVNDLIGEIPNFNNLPDLNNIYLGSNQLSGEIPNFDHLQNLQILELLGNQLSGEIPDFNQLPLLEILNLRQNKLSGAIPNFGKLPLLKDLNLGQNLLTGTIPNFNNFNNLTALNLAKNQFTGNIPSFDKLLQLGTLYLSNNQLLGNIPDFNNLKNLKFITLNDNLLTGKIPNFDSCLMLTNLNVASNYFTFEHLININKRIKNFYYNPQKKFYVDTVFTSTINQDLLVDLNIDDSLSDNTYEWVNLSDPSWEMDLSQDIHSNTYSFKNIQSKDIGRYIVKVTNPSFPSLVLESNVITLQLSTSNEDFNSTKKGDGKSENIYCFSNQLKDQLTCQLTSHIKSIHLIDLSGRKFELRSFQQADNQIKIDLQKLEPGLYIIQLNTSSGWKKAKLVILE